MKQLFTKFILMTIMFTTLSFVTKAYMVSDAGVASATLDSICANGTTTLVLTSYIGNIQWQSYNGSNWIDETNPGATTDNYTVVLLTTTDFRAVVTDVGFPSDTSNVITITVGVTSPTTAGATRCGYGPVSLSASGGGSTFKWYDAPSGGTLLYTGSTFTTNVSSTTTFYASAASNGGGSATPAIPAHDNVYTGLTRGYWFTAPVNFTITSLFVPTEASTDNQSIAVLMFPAGPPPATGTNVQGFTSLYMTQFNPATGPIPVSIPVQAGEHIVIIGSRSADTAYFTATNSYDDGSAFTTIIDGNNVSLSRAGMQDNLAGAAPSTVGLLIDTPTGAKGRVMFSYEIGCESARTPVVATVTTAPAITLTANPPALCQGQSSTLNVSSTNSGYTYTWSPPTGLSGTTGTTVTATPLIPITYTVIADDGTCGAIDSVFMSVGPASVAGNATISTDTLCAGGSAYLSVTGYTGNIQWQSYNGSAWVNETGPGSTTDSYEISPVSNSIYQAIVTSGGCDPDTTITINLAVLTIVDPTVVNDTICAPGIANLSASGAGVLNWFTDPTGGSSINIGTTFNPNISTTTTYYVQASAGGSYQVGPLNTGIGSQLTLAGNNFGLQFDVIQQCTIERVYVSPGISTGNIIINLKDGGGITLDTDTIFVNAFSGLIPVTLGFTVSPGTYQLQLATGSVPLYYNSTNAAYPYVSPGSPISITGGLNPNFDPGQYYYFFYNWEVSQGCASNRVPIVGVVNSPPAVPTVIQNGTILTSSAPANNQWYNNGVLIPGATGTTYDMGLSGSGSYTVTVTIDGCGSTSTPVIYTGLYENMTAAGISIYPNPVKDVISVEFENVNAGNSVLSIYNSLGALVLSTEINNKKSDINFDFPAGVYSVEIKTANGQYVTKVVKL